jgi:hypothetical protein
MHHEQPRLATLAGDLHSHVEEIHLRRLARAPHQRQVDFLTLAPLLGQVGADRRAAHPVALPQKLRMHQRPGDALLAGRARTPFLQDLVDPLPHAVQYRPRPLR